MSVIQQQIKELQDAVHALQMPLEDVPLSKFTEPKQANHVLVSIDESGTARFLVNSDSQGLLTVDCTVQRASHVEPVNFFLRMAFYALRAIFGEYSKMGDWTRTWPCYWRVNLSPVNGPIMPVDFATRSKAIEYEIAWLTDYFL